MPSNVQKTSTTYVRPYLGQVILLGVAQAFLMLGYGAVMPILPFFLLQFGAGAFEYGLLIATFSVFAFIASGPLGVLSDRIGRKPLILLSLAGASVAIAVFGLASSLIILFLARAVEGFFTAGLWPAGDALVGDIVPIEKRGTAYGTLLAGRTTGMIFGPTVGGILAFYTGIRIPYLVCAALAALAFVFSLFFIHDPYRENILLESKVHKGDSQSIWQRFFEIVHKYRSVFATSGILLSIAIIVRFTRIFAIAIVEPMFAMYATDPRTFGFTPLDLGIFFFFFATTNVVSQLVFGRLADTIGHTISLVTSGIVTAIAILLALIATTFVELYLIAILLGMGAAMALPSSAAVAAKAAKPEDRGLVMGFLGMAGSAARATGPIIGGFYYALVLAVTNSPQQATLIPIGLCAAAGILGSLLIIPLLILNYRKTTKPL